MTATLGIVAFVVALLVSVMLHEMGHFAFAKRFGMKATQFFVGFGPTLWSTRRGETEYGVKAIPAGGFVKIVGMTDLEEVDEEDRPRAFYRQPAPQRAVVLVAGSLVHFLIAVVLLLVVFVGIGVPAVSTTVGEVSPCVPSGASARCAAGDEESPAQAAGLRAGDEIVAFEGTQVRDWDRLQRMIRDAGAGPAELVVLRDGERVTLTPDLVERTRPSLDDPEREVDVAVVGFTPRIDNERLGPVTAVQRTGENVGRMFAGTFQALGQIPAAVPDLVRATFGEAERSADGLVGPVGIGKISGDIATDDEPASSRLATFLVLVASLNVFVGIFNLLPLLPLDGGHLAVLGFEQARSRVYRLVGRRDPGRVDLTRLLPAAYLFLVLLIGLSVLLLAADIINPVSVPL
jgi:membrane-associated protease RseP (regulator of RpoE activity)